MERIRRYLIIGASSEVGIAFLQHLEECAGAFPENGKIYVAAHYNTNNEPLRRLAERSKYLQIDPVHCDLGDEGQAERLAERLKEEEPFQGFLYLAAEKMRYEKLKKLDLAQMERDYRIQVQSLAKISQAVLPAMAGEKFGKMVVMLSECTLGMPPKFTAGYTTVKYAALGLMRSLSLEYAEKNVNVNGISPSMMETKFLSEIDERLIEISKSADRKKRSLTVEETAEGIAFLFSKGSDYMNGVNLNFSGGNQV